MEGRKIILAMGGVAFVALIICLSLLLGDQLKPQSCGCLRVISQNFIWLFISLAIIFVACLLYYLFSIRICCKDNAIGKNMEIIYKILDSEEKLIVEDLIRKKGELTQFEISERLGKLKSHRVVRKLEEKGIVDLERKGKTNIVKLTKKLREELVK